MIHAAARSVHEGFDRHGRLAALFVVLTLCGMLVVRARGKHFWHDEVYTILASDLPTATLWRASRDGLDLAPPLNTILTGVAHAALGVGLVSTRLPAMTGFVVACLLGFVMARRRANVLAGLAAVLLPCFTAAMEYAYEARGYGVTVGCFALALFAWSEAGAGRSRWLAVMAVALTAGVWAHYYAALAFVPIASGELVRQLARRRFEPRPWIALGAAAAGTLPLLPLARSAVPQAEHFWTRLEPVGVTTTYGAALGSLATPPFGLAALILGILALVQRMRRPRHHATARRLPPHEVTAGLVSLAIPALGVLLGSSMGIPFVPRYVLFAVVGLALVVPLTVWRLGADGGLAEIALGLGLAAAFVSDAGATFTRDRFVFRDPTAGRPLLTERLASGQPVVFAGGISYLELWYHLAPDQQRQALYLADPQMELRDTGSDTIDRGYLALARWTPVPVVAYATFVREHRTFDVYACGRDWLGLRLRRDGASLSEVRAEAGCWLYRARLPSRS